MTRRLLADAGRVAPAFIALPGVAIAMDVAEVLRGPETLPPLSNP
jgi:hypothetical protein